MRHRLNAAKTIRTSSRAASKDQGGQQDGQKPGQGERGAAVTRQQRSPFCARPDLELLEGRRGY